MADLQDAIESILINSNIQRIEEESLGRPVPKQEAHIGSVSSFKSSHVPESNIAANKSVDSSDHLEPPMDDSGSRYDIEKQDRLRSLLVDPRWEVKINSMIDDYMCDSILKSSKSVTKKDFSLKIINHNTLQLLFNNNKIEASAPEGGFITGDEVIYVDYVDLQVDFLILRKNNSGLEDITSHYKVLLNNELVPFS